MGNSESVIKFRQKRKQDLVDIYGSQCSLCGYHECIGALEFHHIVPSEKSFSLSTGNCHSLEEDLKEAEKCLLVCSNCHKEIHLSQKWTGIDLWKYQVCNEELKSQLILKNSKEERKCLKCGNPITIHSTSGLCRSCVQLNGKRIENKPSREELKKLIREKSFLEIGRMFECSDNAVRKWCDKYCLPRKKEEIKSYSDEEWTKI